MTGEHKIKASALRAEFGSEKMVIGHFGNSTNRMRSAQSVKSKALHFTARVCALCNNTHTQPADREFDYFHEIARSLFAEGKDPHLVFDDSRYAVGSDAYLNLFRYFAKLLCCHLAEVSAPRPLHMARFAIGQARANCVWLSVGEDWTYKQTSAQLGTHQYAAHGGLVVYGDKNTGGATAFHSTLTVGPLRYVFYSRLNRLERMELRFGYRNFYHWCCEQVRQAMEQPMSDRDRLALGFSVEESTEK